MLCSFFVPFLLPDCIGKLCSYFSTLIFNTKAIIACKSFWCYDVILGKCLAATFSQLFGYSCWDDLTCRLQVVSNSLHLWMISMIEYRLLGMVLKMINCSVSWAFESSFDVSYNTPLFLRPAQCFLMSVWSKGQIYSEWSSLLFFAWG